MKAVIMTAPAADGSTTRVADIDEPLPGPGQVAIDVAYAGVNFIDVMARRGDPGYASTWPYVPGLEVAGTIRSVGSGVRDLRAGERVAAFTPGGGLAEVAIAAAEVTVAVPPEVPLGTAAAAPLVVSTALLLLTDRARIRPGESVLMHSASGGIGSVVSQVAAALGSGRRIGTVGRPDKIAAGLAAGWDEVFAREAGLAEAVRQVAPDGVDVILDPAGTALLDLDLSIAAPGGRVILFGNAAGGAQPPLPPAGRLIGGNVGVLGFSMSRLSATAPKAVASALAKGLEMIAAAQIRPEVTIAGPLTAVAAIHDLLAAGRGSGKYVTKVHGLCEPPAATDRTGPRCGRRERAPGPYRRCHQAPGVQPDRSAGPGTAWHAVSRIGKRRD